MDKISRTEARSKGLKRYFTGVPCQRGHTDERLVLKGTCCECHRIATRKSYSTDLGRSKAAARQKVWRDSDPLRNAATCRKNRLAKYGLNEQTFQLLLSTQNNSCAICFDHFFESPHIDHCHSTGKVRGLLCGNCNRGIGLFKDQISRLTSAINYLTE